MHKTKMQTTPAILIKFAGELGTSVRKNRLQIPAAFGNGYCTGFVFNEHISMLISNYELRKDILINNPEININKRVIFFKFQNIFPVAKEINTKGDTTGIPSVLIATSRIHIDDVIAIHTNTATINIEVDADYLNSLFNQKKLSPVLRSLLQNTQPLLFEQLVYPTVQKIADDIAARQMNETFELFYLRIKAEELICRLLMELEKRDNTPLYPLNNADVKVAYNIKEQILQHLDRPPKIESLAQDAHMSPTKLKRLFKQVFGDSIFNYYQTFRMKEAARLLTQENFSVSEVGYRLGFTNLSHFSRAFDKHIGMKPKQYSKSNS